MTDGKNYLDKNCGIVSMDPVTAWKRLEGLRSTLSEMHQSELVRILDAVYRGGAKDVENGPSRVVTQPWTQRLPMMQQTVLLTAIRGPGGTQKYGPVEMLQRWYRRCVLLSAMDGKVLDNPFDSNGGSFTGPSLPRIYGRWEAGMNILVGKYLRVVDALPLHFHMQFVHAAEIVGYKHQNDRIRVWWQRIYVRFARNLHMNPESEAEMDERLGDNREGWLKYADVATVD